MNTDGAHWPMLAQRLDHVIGVAANTTCQQVQAERTEAQGKAGLRVHMQHASGGYTQAVGKLTQQLHCDCSSDAALFTQVTAACS